jgi:hypothetical protein
MKRDGNNFRPVFASAAIHFGSLKPYVNISLYGLASRDGVLLFNAKIIFGS